MRINNLFNFGLTGLTNKGLIEGWVRQELDKSCPKWIEMNSIICFEFGDPKNERELIIPIDVYLILFLCVQVDELPTRN